MVQRLNFFFHQSVISGNYKLFLYNSRLNLIQMYNNNYTVAACLIINGINSILETLYIRNVLIFIKNNFLFKWVKNFVSLRQTNMMYRYYKY